MIYIDNQGMKVLSKGLMAASSKPLILSILAQGETYGYDIIQKIESLSEGELEWADGMLYPLLHKMTSEGLISAQWRVIGEERKRKYYRLTSIGIETLQQEKSHWRFMNNLLNKTWNQLNLGENAV